MGENLVSNEAPSPYYRAPARVSGEPDLTSKTPIQVDLTLTLGPAYARRLQEILTDGEMVPLTIVFVSPWKDSVVKIPISELQQVQW